MRFSRILVGSLIGVGAAIDMGGLLNKANNVKQAILARLERTSDKIVDGRLSLAWKSPLDELFAQLDSVGAVSADGHKYYTEMSSSEIENSPSKQLLGSLPKLKDQFVVRFEKWEDGEVRRIVLETAKMLGADIWATSNSGKSKFIDVKCDKLVVKKIVEEVGKRCKDARYSARLLIGDLPQAIFETLGESQADFDPKEEENMQATMKNAEKDGRELFRTQKDIFFKQFRHLDTIYSWFDMLTETYPDLLTVEWIGQTYEGRDIRALRISGHKSDNESIRTVVITGGIHAREWISISTVCYIVSSLLADYDAGNKKVRHYLEELDFLFLPVMNPDGYAYTWSTERLWRKNRQQTYHPRCFGIDIDHSFNFHFERGLDSPCSEDYSGQDAFESLESYAWDNYLNSTRHSHPIYAYIDLHSYAEEVLYPYAYSCTEMPRDEENLLELAYGLSQAIRLRSGVNYEVMSACEDRGADLLPEMGAGSALDYMYHNKAYSAFVLKLRDSGSRGFLLPSKFIVPVGREVYSAVKYFADFLTEPPA